MASVYGILYGKTGIYNGEKCKISLCFTWNNLILAPRFTWNENGQKPTV